MNKERSLKIVYIIVALIIVGFLLLNDDGFVKYLNLKKEINELDQKIDTTKVQIDKLNLQIDSLQNSDVKIEQVARDKYRMKYEDEIPVKINKQ